MQYRVVRAISRTVVAAGTAGAIATTFWLLLNGSDRYSNPAYLDTKSTDDNEHDGDWSDQDRQQHDTSDSFALLPVVSESDDESEEDALGYTADYFTPHYDVCVLSVSVQTLVDPLPDVPPVNASDCRLCRTAATTEGCDAAGDGVDLGGKLRALSFSETDSSSNGSVLSTMSELEEDHDDEKPGQCSRTRSRMEQWLYVRL